MNKIVDDINMIHRLTIAFFLVLVGGLWGIGTLYTTSYKVKHNMAMLVQDHLPRLDTIYTLQTDVKALELVLYNYYETTNSDAYQKQWTRHQQKIIQSLTQLDHNFVVQLNQYLNDLNSIASHFDTEMQDHATDWDLLRKQLADSQQISDEFDQVLGVHAASLKQSFTHYSSNTEALISKLVISQISFSGFVLLLLAVLGFALKRQLRQHKINRELALYPEKNPNPILRLSKQGEALYLNPSAMRLAKVLNCSDNPVKLLPINDQTNFQTNLASLKDFKSDDYALGDSIFTAIFQHTEDSNSTYVYLLDVTQRSHAEQQLLHNSTHDLLTTLPNRRKLEQDLEQQTTTSLAAFGLLLIKAKRLDLISASLGYEFSDKVLKQMSSRLNQFIVRQTHCRLYSFELGSWVVICNSTFEPATLRQLAEDLVGLFIEPLAVDELQLSMQCSAGVTLYPQGGCSSKELLRNADAALRQGSKEGLSVRIYSEDLTEKTTRWLQLEQGLNQAINNGELSLYIQAKVDSQTTKFVGGEVLLRWQHHGIFISRSEFIPIAEESDLIITIGNWVLLTACQQWVAWNKEGLEPKRIAVNISAQHFMQVDFVDTVSHVINKTGMPAFYLELEITEEVASENPEKLIQTMDKLKALGVNLAIDDFGTGYSSLSYLMQFPIDTLKIDKAFVTNMTKSDNDAALVRMIMSLAKELELEVVAEGVETQDQHQALAKLGCDYIQGFYFYRPVPLEQYRSLLLNIRDGDD